MKKLTFSLLIFGLGLIVSSVQAQTHDAQNAFKKHINEMVLEVEKAETATEKRQLLHESLDDMISAIKQVESNKSVPETDKKKLAPLKKDLIEKKNELSGLYGYTRVKNNQLNQFAQYVQQDLEQADNVVTLSLTTALLIVIILLLI